MSGGRMLPFSVEALLGEGFESSNQLPNGHTAGQRCSWSQETTQLDRKSIPHERCERRPEKSQIKTKSCSPDTTANPIQVELYCKDLWQQFHRFGNEMIITKAGRRMFPALKVKVSGLDPDAYYILWVDVVPVDDNRYRYVYPSSQWMVAGTGDPPLPQRHYTHSDSPATGRHWMSQFISFDRLKLTNNKQPQTRGQVSLHSMHKYQPRVCIMRTNDLQTDPESQLDLNRALTYTFKETSFITVTAYQNQQITRLKIASNPFAKGFRDTVKTRESCSQFERTRSGIKIIPECSAVPTMPFAHRHAVPVYPYPYLLSPPHPAAFYSPAATFYSPCCLGGSCGHTVQSPAMALPPLPPPTCLLPDYPSTSAEQTVMVVPSSVHNAPPARPSWESVRPKLFPQAPVAVAPANQIWPYTPGVYTPTDFMPKM